MVVGAGVVEGHEVPDEGVEEVVTKVKAKELRPTAVVAKDVDEEAAENPRTEAMPLVPISKQVTASLLHLLRPRRSGMRQVIVVFVA